MDLEGPALAPPDGVTSNFNNPPNRNDLAWGVLLTCSIITTICFCVRAYGRLYLARKFQTEEVLVTLAYWVFIFGVCYSFVLPLLKIAILVEWCRVFVLPGSKAKSVFFWGCVVVIFIQITANIAIVVALNMQCTPHSAIWDFTIESKCWELFKLQVASASIHLICDVAIFLLPQRMIWTLKMTWRKRLGISIIFGLGLVACVSAGFRLGVTITHGKAADAVYTLGPLAFWATAEMTCGFFIVCIPCIPKILRETGVIRAFKKRFGMKATDPDSRPTAETYGGTDGSKNSKLRTTSSNAYYKLDEDGVPLQALSGSESTEQLRAEQPVNSHGVTVTRTTQVMVTHDENGHNEGGTSKLYLKSQQPWPR
ncbi:hypothetical protein G7Z17_g19 [Cylindrodendrum hubeiense]|uniref:Rhodopsin domain-containing protein n=1 Tax=Cylindrodendrum hubeiense TaxID=595255 RepID=A0A9P5HM68_9HYPO|nr:hypothetical protein G7Z17_g19 [Cylindrodendrum hubeiense]